MGKLKLRDFACATFNKIDVGGVFRTEALNSRLYLKVQMGSRLLETGDVYGEQTELAVDLSTGILHKIEHDTRCIPLTAELEIRR